MIGSNISITSNIYIRKNPDIRKDREYTGKITGAKLIKKLRRQYAGFDAIPFSEVQNQIADESTACMHAKNAEKSFGAVLCNGKLKWMNRCEYTACPHYEKCSSQSDFQKITHAPLTEDNSDDRKSLHDFFESLGIIIQDDEVLFERDRSTSVVEESPKEYIAPKEQTAEAVKRSTNDYIEITAPDPIISAPVDSHIILNSGPGTGKTYTIIQRLIYILSNDLCPAEEIYILCYTRSAKRVIETKLEQVVTDGVIPPAAKNICILTFDSYATYFLMAMKEQGVITENIEGYDYNGRIKLFNKYITPEDFDDVSYFIVDEIQDLVNERAEMVLKILSCLKCGYLLAGDRCQSIYDYEADDDATLDSVKFYELAEKQFPADMQRYEITVNRRQAPELAMEAAGLRKVLLTEPFDEQNKKANEIMRKFSGQTKAEDYIKSIVHAPDVSTAVLCRNNGEAEYISGLLCERGISHTLNRGVNNNIPLPRWIADVFWDYCRDTISRKDFTDRISFRCRSGPDPDVIWAELCRLTETANPDEISVPRLLSALTVANNIPSDFYDEAPKLTISTIHKAKGSEFDEVFLIGSDIKASDDSAEEARIRYVALTRPKTKFVTMQKKRQYFKRTLSGRVIETGYHNVYKKSNRFCKCITVGLSGDVDSSSFVSGDFESVLNLQEYIIHNIRLYDKLSAVRSSITGLYELFHNGKQIGMLSKGMIDEIDMGVSATDYRYNLPDRLENLYVSGITAEILRKYDPSVPFEYQKSKVCFGIQVTGLAKLVFEKK